MFQKVSLRMCPIIFQLDYKVCIFPLVALNDEIDEAKIDYFLISVIGHNVEMILHSEVKRRKRVNNLKSR